MSQLPLFSDRAPAAADRSRLGSFVDNMKLPIHRWFRYSAGFSAEWVLEVLRGQRCETVLDPFCGSGTVNIAADWLGIPSFGFEAQPFVARIASAKTSWNADLRTFANLCARFAFLRSDAPFDQRLLDNPLLAKCFSPQALARLLQFRSEWESLRQTESPEIARLAFLAITAILRDVSHAGTAQWQYIQPRKTSRASDPDTALRAQFSAMLADMRYFRAASSHSRALIKNADARALAGLAPESVDMVITSPPYANNYDYADATRFEMTFWGEVSGWSDLHAKTRKYLICSSSQHAAREKFSLDALLSAPRLAPIRGELSETCARLGQVRLTKGGRKHYHTMVAAYFADMAQVLASLYRVMRPGGKALLVIGDSAPYGVYVPVDEWLGKIAMASGFQAWDFEKIRDRNTRWKNRKHTVPLKEGIMRISK